MTKTTRKRKKKKSSGSIEIIDYAGAKLDLSVNKRVNMNPLLANDTRRMKADKEGICLEKVAVNVNVHGLADNQLGIDITNLVLGGPVLQQVSDIWDVTDTTGNNSNKVNRSYPKKFINNGTDPKIFPNVKYILNRQNQLIPFKESEIQWHILYDLIKLEGEPVSVRVLSVIGPEEEDPCEAFNKLDKDEIKLCLQQTLDKHREKRDSQKVVEDTTEEKSAPSQEPSEQPVPKEEVEVKKPDPPTPKNVVESKSVEVASPVHSRPYFYTDSQPPYHLRPIPPIRGMVNTRIPPPPMAPVTPRPQEFLARRNHGNYVANYPGNHVNNHAFSSPGYNHQLQQPPRHCSPSPSFPSHVTHRNNGNIMNHMISAAGDRKCLKAKNATDYRIDRRSTSSHRRGKFTHQCNSIRQMQVNRPRSSQQDEEK